ncbi:gamma-glutamylcyclotransferase family protein [Candidatus Chlamydia corallus]|uniref:gamma-glutamylcyclotransferase family protein n=1 Tax=Candidatus Chlamydia corallus TaxID=2038470 RepID=UPI000C2F88B9|nr:gamma-glutamylcyclotransferase family protein [Candidatus Chlamydia corallus]
MKQPVYFIRPIIFLGLGILFLSSCNQKLSLTYHNSSKSEEFFVGGNRSISQLPHYSSAFRAAQVFSQEHNDPHIIAKTDEESRRIWREIHKNLKIKGSYIPISTYGSLMHPKSAALTLKTYRPSPIWINGYERSFNIDTGKYLKNGSRRRTPQDGPENRAVLNLIKSPGQRCNAVGLEMTEEDFIVARKREGIYSLYPVEVCSYPEGSPCGIAYAWIADASIYSKEILPIKGYYSLVWESVSSPDSLNTFGDAFGEDYLRSTFLANGTSILCVHESYKKISPQP